MSVTVRSAPITSISVTQGAQAGGAVTVKTGADLTVQGLKNVVSTDLQDGYTLVYDSTTNKWITQQLDGAQISSVDGGTY
jgi:hypothetical protein